MDRPSNILTPGSERVKSRLSFSGIYNDGSLNSPAGKNPPLVNSPMLVDATSRMNISSAHRPTKPRSHSVSVSTPHMLRTAARTDSGLAECDSASSSSQAARGGADEESVFSQTPSRHGSARPSDASLHIPEAVMEPVSVDDPPATLESHTFSTVAEDDDNESTLNDTLPMSEEDAELSQSTQPCTQDTIRGSPTFLHDPALEEAAHTENEVFRRSMSPPRAPSAAAEDADLCEAMDCDIGSATIPVVRGVQSPRVTVSASTSSANAAREGRRLRAHSCRLADRLSSDEVDPTASCPASMLTGRLRGCGREVPCEESNCTHSRSATPRHSPYPAVHASLSHGTNHLHASHRPGSRTRTMRGSLTPHHIAVIEEDQASDSPLSPHLPDLFQRMHNMDPSASFPGFGRSLSVDPSARPLLRSQLVAPALADVAQRHPQFQHPQPPAISSPATTRRHIDTQAHLRQPHAQQAAALPQLSRGATVPTPAAKHGAAWPQPGTSPSQFSANRADLDHSPRRGSQPTIQAMPAPPSFNRMLTEPNANPAIPMTPRVHHGPRTHKLPLAQCESESHRDLALISGDTLVDVLEGMYSNEYDSVHIIDCRFPFEFNNGHIQGAHNFWRMELIEHNFLGNPVTDLTRGDRSLIVFHCEFSSHRGPSQWRHLRQMDHFIMLDQACQQAIIYPEIYVLQGGYKRFFNEHPQYCTGSPGMVGPSYLPMVDPRHKQELSQCENILRCSREMAKEARWKREGAVSHLHQLVRREGVAALKSVRYRPGSPVPSSAAAALSPCTPASQRLPDL
eukprot:m.244432 g.244432  ORF g.244432 m.244432 type:complete len:795 (-) comp14453_c0_seq1:375-2759(-)